MGMAKRFIGFMPKDAPDGVIVAYIKEAGKIATGVDRRRQGSEPGPVAGVGKALRTGAKDPSLGRAKRVTNERH